jgi:DNA helicase II / ATP-dependent DNA helicase PcrA
MDIFEPVRDAAARLRAELVADGADSFRPMELVEAAVRRLDLELIWLPPGDPALKGARAVFDEQSGAICGTDAGDASERVMLVAHEIGHATVHVASSQCTADNIDPSRSIEAVPVGLQRVEDYGASERRELQANVFAREFLLPRIEARRLHLDERLGATVIAERMQLSKDLVRQQLLDALLLPPMTRSTAPQPERSARPDPSQDTAASHRGSAFQLQAGPGTGKTRTLVKRVLSLIQDGVDPAAILVLTFSNRAAGELSERIAAAVPRAASSIWIGTFHAFGLDIIRRYHDKLGLRADPVLFDRSDAIEILEDILPILPLVHYRNLWDPALVLRDLVAAISRAKDEVTGPVRYRVLAQSMCERAANDSARAAAEKCLEVAQVYELYEQALRARAAVDFGDLVMRPTLLLEGDKEVQAAVQLRHRHVLVDEYQDVNRASARLLRALTGNGRRLWVVGDSRQSIYRFRGASSANMMAFTDEYPGAIVDRLSVNYRSTKEIVETIAAFAPHMGASEGMLALTLIADRGCAGIQPEVRRFNTLDQEMSGVAASVRELEAAGVRLGDQAVLCRSNSRLNELAAALEARGIPVLHLGSFFERDEVRDLLALMSLVIDPLGDGLTRVGAMPRYSMPLQDVYSAIRFMRATDGSVLGKLADAASSPGMSEAGARGLARLAMDLAGVRISSSPWEVLTTYLLDRTDQLAEMARSDYIADRIRAVAVWQLLNFVRDRNPIGAGLQMQRTLDRVRQLVLLAEERDLRQVPANALHMDAVRLMTVHGSKGLEFEAVHVPGLTLSSFPSSNRGQRCPPPDGMVAGAEGLTSAEEAKQAHGHEEQCLFFVAASRARTHLRLYQAERQRNGNARQPSPFVESLPAQLLRYLHSPAMMPLPPDAPLLAPIAVVWPTTWQVTDSRLQLYEKCPRRFFYTHVLSLGGARKQTAFSRTHDCLYELIRWLSAARIVAEPDIKTVELEFERIWQARGPIDHAFAPDYRRLATRLVAAVVRLGADRRFQEIQPLTVTLPNGTVLVEPHEMAELPNGMVVLRHVRTGHKRSDEYDRLAYTLYHLAARIQFGTKYVVEALHLTDETIETVKVTAQKMHTRQTKSDAMLAGIVAGEFPPEIDSVTCPRCPHFFVCGATPRGSLTLG